MSVAVEKCQDDAVGHSRALPGVILGQDLESPADSTTVANTALLLYDETNITSPARSVHLDFRCACSHAPGAPKMLYLSCFWDFLHAVFFV